MERYRKKIAILGSTGSIGTQTLEIVREQGDLQVMASAPGVIYPFWNARSVNSIRKQPCCGRRRMPGICGSGWQTFR